MQCDLSKQTRVVLVSWVLDVFLEVFPKALVDIGHLPTAAALQSTWEMCNELYTKHMPMA